MQDKIQVKNILALFADLDHEKYVDSFWIGPFIKGVADGKKDSNPNINAYDNIFKDKSQHELYEYGFKIGLDLW